MLRNITVKEFLQLPKESYTLIDVRGDIAYNHGHIKESIPIHTQDIEEKLHLIDKSKKVVIYCMKGLISADAAEHLCDLGYDAYNLEGGFGKWLIETITEDQQRTRDIENSIRKKFHKSLFSRFAKALNTYELLQENDKVAVCISGGKDSMIMAKLFQEIQRHNKFPFELVFLCMDPGYNEYNRTIIEKNAKLLGIPLTIFESNIFETVFNIEKSPCYLCARMRRGHLYNKARELGCNKIALGHHYDDVIETTLMGMLYGAQMQSMMPKIHSTNFEGMELIRPMYLIREDDIKHWRDYNNLKFIQCACHFTDTCSTEGGDSNSKRMEVKQLIRQMKETNPYVESNIFKSTENVKLDTLIAYKFKGEEHHFLDWYNEK